MARKAADVRQIITLQCGDCRERNYTTVKNRRNDPQRLELKKYCPRCRGHKGHREVRENHGQGYSAESQIGYI